MAGRQRPRLVEDDDRGRAQPLERRAALEHDPAPRAARARPGDERDRRRQDERAGRGHDQHRERRHGRSGDEPAEPGDSQGDWQEQRRRPIGEARSRCPIGLGLLDEAHDARIRRRRRRAQRANVDRLPDDARAAADLLPGRAPRRQRLAGQRRLVEHGAPARERAVDGHDLAGEHHQEVAGQHLARRHVDEPPALAPVCRRGCALRERGQLTSRTAKGVLVEQLAAGQHQRHDETGRELAERQGTGDREQSDDVRSQLTAQQPASDRERERSDDGEQNGGEDGRAAWGSPARRSPEPTASARTMTMGMRAPRTPPSCVRRRARASALATWRLRRNPQHSCAPTPTALAASLVACWKTTRRHP